jgi:hypothetical protein
MENQPSRKRQCIIQPMREHEEAELPLRKLWKSGRRTFDAEQSKPQ